MTRTWLCFMALAGISGPVWGQKVDIEIPDRAKIVLVQTALNHLTVLEMSEPLVTVAVGSPMFKIEWRENKVFIEPTEPHIATNLFVWTASGLRLAVNTTQRIEEISFNAVIDRYRSSSPWSPAPQ